MILKTTTLHKIRRNKDCHRALEDRWEKSFYTIETWLRTDNPLLCHVDSLQIIAAHLKEDIESITIKQEHDFKPVV